MIQGQKLTLEENFAVATKPKDFKLLVTSVHHY